MNKKILALLIAVALILIGAIYLKKSGENVGFSNQEMKIIKEYIEKNISNLSEQKEVLGGKFYITDLQLDDLGKGYVEYEDGHIALKANFNFSINKNNEVVISNFTIIQPENNKIDKQINNFKECQEAGYPIAESYPMQCMTPDGKTFIDK